LQKIAIAMLIAMQACFVILQPPGRIWQFATNWEPHMRFAMKTMNVGFQPIVGMQP
jgi:hypothetical protein